MTAKKNYGSNRALAAFGTALKELMTTGRRPNKIHSDRWTNEDLAKKLDVSPTIVSQYRNGKNAPLKEKIDAFLNCFFSSSETTSAEYISFRRTIRQAVDPTSEYHDIKTIRLFWEHLLPEMRNPSIDDEKMRRLEGLRACTIADAAAFLVGKQELSLSAALLKANTARENAFDVKYGTLQDLPNERKQFAQLHKLPPWDLEIEKLFLLFGGHFDMRAICVGIGSQDEGADFYKKFTKKIDVVDISTHVIRENSIRLNLTCILGTAEALPCSDAKYDAYFCFRTYNSTLFDIEAATSEARRVLKGSGSIIVSIPRLYIQKDGKVVLGLSRTNYDFSSIVKGEGYGRADEQYVVQLLKEIASSLLRRGFSDIRFHSGAVENYVCARKFD